VPHRTRPLATDGRSTTAGRLRRFGGTLVLATVLTAGCEPATRMDDAGSPDVSTSDVPVDDTGTDTPPPRCAIELDADGDGLADGFEGGPSRDADRDGLADYLDDDADGDGATDRLEAASATGCDARDLDGDRRPDHLDADADGDGLSDREERDVLGTDPLSADTDGDGDDDGVEHAFEHADPLDARYRLRADDAWLHLPHGVAVQHREMALAISPRRIDVIVLVDATASMAEAARAISTGAPAIVDALFDRGPDVAVAIAGFTGFGGLCDGPVCVDGPAGELPFQLYAAASTDRGQVIAGAEMILSDALGGPWVSHTEALYQALESRGLPPWLASAACAIGPDRLPRLGHACRRLGTLPIVVVVTDAASRNGPLTEGVMDASYIPSDFAPDPPPHSHDETLAATRRAGARVVGLVADVPGCGTSGTAVAADAQLAAWARATGGLDRAGDPVALSIACDGRDVGARLIEATSAVIAGTPMKVTLRLIDGAEGEETPTIDATTLVRRLDAARLLPVGEPVVECPRFERCGGAVFEGVRIGDGIVVGLELANRTLRDADHLQWARLGMSATGDGAVALGDRSLTVIVPTASDPAIH
jgi:hypothetical protein